MSKAEKAAEESGYSKDPLCRAEYTAYEVKEAFIDGYHQAEKDNELTWEDIRELYIIFAEVDVEIDFYKTDIKSETIGYYQEVLKRFKAKKNVEQEV